MKFDDSGFTMIELAVVVSIVGIIVMLLARVLPASGQDRNGTVAANDWEQAACRFNQNVAQNATEYYAIFSGNYPNSPDCLNPRFLDRIPNCPANKVPYYYDQHHLIVCPLHPR